MGLQDLQDRKVQYLEVTVGETPHQSASFKCKVPEDEAALYYVENNKINMIQPTLCFSD
jgi:hypothetical protein